MLQTTRASDIFGHRFHFDVFSTVDTNTICTPFRFDLDLQERFQIDAFLIKSLSDLARTESLNASKCLRKRKP